MVTGASLLTSKDFGLFVLMFIITSKNPSSYTDLSGYGHEYTTWFVIIKKFYEAELAVSSSFLLFL